MPVPVHDEENKTATHNAKNHDKKTALGILFYNHEKYYLKFCCQ